MIIKLHWWLILVVLTVSCNKKSDDNETKALDMYQDHTDSSYVNKGRLAIPPEVFLARKLLTANLRKPGMLSDGYLTFYIHDEFSQFMFVEDSAVPGTFKMRENVPDEIQRLCINNPDYDNFHAAIPYCDYVDINGDTVNVLGWVKAAVEVWKLALINYLKQSVIPAYAPDETLSGLVNEALIEDLIKSRKIVRTTNADFADFLIWIPWTAKAGYFQDIDTGQACYMSYTDGIALKEIVPHRQVGYLHLPLNNPLQDYTKSCLDFPVLVHEMGHILGTGDTYSYQDNLYQMEEHPINTIMRDNNGFSQDFIPARDDQLAITTVFLHSVFIDSPELDLLIDEQSGCLQQISTPVSAAGIGCQERPEISSAVR